MKKLIVLVVVMVVSSQAMALIEYNDGGTHDISTTINEDVWVDWESPGMGTTVNVLDVGSIPFPFYSRFTLKAFNDSNVTISDGAVNMLYAKDNGNVTISDGAVSKHLHIYGSSTVTLSGGTVDGVFRLWISSTLLIDGYDFAIDGVPVGYGDITSIFGGYEGDEPFRTLTGILQNGDTLDNQFLIGNDAQITLIPEPCTLFLLGLGGLVLRRRKA